MNWFEKLIIGMMVATGIMLTAAVYNAALAESAMFPQADGSMIVGDPDRGNSCGFYVTSPEHAKITMALIDGYMTVDAYLAAMVEMIGEPAPEGFREFIVSHMEENCTDLVPGQDVRS